jgi:hypothetical protein
MERGPNGNRTEWKGDRMERGLNGNRTEGKGD